MKKALPVIIILVLAGLGLWYFLQPSASDRFPCIASARKYHGRGPLF